MQANCMLSCSVCTRKFLTLVFLFFFSPPYQGLMCPNVALPPSRAVSFLPVVPFSCPSLAGLLPHGASQQKVPRPSAPHLFGAADTLPLSFLFDSQRSVHPTFVCLCTGNKSSRESLSETVMGTAWQSCEPGLESVKSEGKGWRREARASFAKAVIASVVLTSGLPGCCLGWCVIKLIALTSCDAITP